MRTTQTTCSKCLWSLSAPPPPTRNFMQIEATPQKHSPLWRHSESRCFKALSLREAGAKDAQHTACRRWWL